MATPFDPTQHIVAYTIIRPITPQNTVPSGECGISSVDTVRKEGGVGSMIIAAICGPT
jgi:hypothetical protein